MDVDQVELSQYSGVYLLIARYRDWSLPESVHKYAYYIHTCFIGGHFLEIDGYILPGTVRNWQRVKKSGDLIARGLRTVIGSTVADEPFDIIIYPLPVVSLLD